MRVTRLANLPEGIIALTATTRGMVDNNMMRAAQQAFGELLQEVNRAGLREQVTSYLSVAPTIQKARTTHTVALLPVLYSAIH